MAKNKNTEILVTVYHVTRGPVSTMGNPSYIFHTDEGKFRTVTDSGAAYALENDFSVGATLDQEVTLIITTRGRVFDWRK
jgi:hypothetical protein